MKRKKNAKIEESLRTEARSISTKIKAEGGKKKGKFFGNEGIKNNADCRISAVNPVKHLITMQKIHPHIQKIEGGKEKKRADQLRILTLCNAANTMQ